MAWISGLADRAENMLNKLDQNAATALNQVPGTDAISEMRKSLSSSALSLKTLSPARSNKSMSGLMNEMNVTKNPNDILQISSSSRSSRRNSIDSKSDVITINVPTESIGTSMSSSFTEPQELTAFKIALEQVSSERDELRSRLLAINRDEEITRYQTRNQELETLTRCLNEERECLQQEALKLQTTNSAHIHSISELETNLAKLQQEYLDTAQKLQIQMKEISQQRQDFQDYRLKAQHTLQMKDNLIAELKTSGMPSSEVQTFDGNDGETRMLQLENDAVRVELKNVKEERQNLLTQLEQLRQQWQELSNEHERQLNEVRENEVQVRKELRLERERMLKTESEQRAEIYTLRQQYHQHVGDAKARLQDAERKLQQATNARELESNKVANLTDTEIRLRTLTQALVDKQNTVENITAERNALRIQLEKLQEQHSSFVVRFQSSNSTRNPLLSNSTDDAKAQFPLLMAPSPFDNRVARRVKRAYSSLDSAGVRLGKFLRRYPLMRVFVLIYVALLHIWVMFVLLWSTPN